VLHFEVINNSTAVQARFRDDIVHTFETGLDFVLDLHRRQIASVFISLLTLAWSFTSQYRQNKESSVSFLSSIAYFVHVCLLVSARILAFEMFAFSLGPGHFDVAMAFVGCHAILMALLHFVFSDSLAQCGVNARSKAERCGTFAGSFSRRFRRALLVVDNCVLNGLANLYFHNNLEVYVQHTSRDQNRRRFSAESVAADDQHLKTNYVGSDVRQRTLIRQLMFDAIFLAENVAMVVLAGQTGPRDYLPFHDGLATAVATLHLSGVAIKLAFYLSCHPWASLIRPRSCWLLNTSCIFFSRQYKLDVDLKAKSASVKADVGEDRQRYRAIRRLLPGLFSEK